MTSSHVPAPSPSKLRRLRAASTKRRLFESANNAEPLLMIQSHLAILTSTINNLLAVLSYSVCPTTPPTCSESNDWNRDAPVFTPHGSAGAGGTASSDNQCLTSPCAATGYKRGGPNVIQGGKPQVPVGGNSCAICWEPLPACRCGIAMLCGSCALAGHDQRQQYDQQQHQQSRTPEVIRMMGAGSITKLELFDNGRVLVASLSDGGGSMVVEVGSGSVAHLLTAAKANGLRITSHFSKSYLAVEGQTNQEPSPARCSFEDETVPELTTEQMCEIVDMAVSKLSQTVPAWQWQAVPAEAFEQLVANLKDKLSGREHMLHSRQQARKLMESTTKMCTDLVLEHIDRDRERSQQVYRSD